MGTESYNASPFTLEFDGEGGAEFVTGKTGEIPCFGSPCWWKRKDGWIWRCCRRPTGEICCEKMFRENDILNEGELPYSPEQSS